MSQSNLFKQHDHNAVLSFFCFIYFEPASSHVTCYKYIICIDSFLLSYFNSIFFLRCMMSILKQMTKKSLAELMNRLPYNIVHLFWWQGIQQAISNQFSFFQSLFWGNIVLCLFVSCIVLRQLKYFQQIYFLNNFICSVI